MGKSGPKDEGAEIKDERTESATEKAEVDAQMTGEGLIAGFSDCWELRRRISFRDRKGAALQACSAKEPQCPHCPYLTSSTGACYHHTSTPTPTTNYYNYDFHFTTLPPPPHAAAAASARLRRCWLLPQHEKQVTRTEHATRS